MDIPPLYNVSLAIIVGTLFAIVYSLRILVLLERRIARMDFNIMKITESVFSREEKLGQKLSRKK
ncbi:MAG: hypothetical protein NTV63_02650 [Candidatus Woesearchaeota archaeon]|nr:hypothetical protein [Candidatus Woesearchaeota archaeon]